jgi:hypothetical protein
MNQVAKQADDLSLALGRLTLLGGDAARARFDEFEADLRVILAAPPHAVADIARWRTAIRHAHAYFAWSWDARGLGLLPALNTAMETWAARKEQGAVLDIADLIYFIGWCFEASNVAQCRLVLPGLGQVSRSFARHARFARPHRKGPPRIVFLSMFAGPREPMTLGPRLLIEALLALPGGCEISILAWRFHDEDWFRELRAAGIAVVTTAGQIPSEQLAAIEPALDKLAPDILITDMNNAVPIAVFARRAAPVQIFLQAGLPAFPPAGLDAVFDSFGMGPKETGWGRARLLPFRPNWDLASLLAPVDSAQLAEERKTMPEGGPIFGCYGRLVKLTPAYLAAVERILLAVPEAQFVTGGTGDAASVLAFAARSPAGARMHVQQRFVPGHAWGQLLDLFLDTWPLTGGESVRETMAKGCPVVCMHSEEMPAQDLQRDPQWLARDWDEFVMKATALLRDQALRAKAGKDAAAFAERMADPAPFRDDTARSMALVLCDARRRQSSAWRLISRLLGSHR